MKRRPLHRFLPTRLFLLVAPMIAAWPAHRLQAQTNGTWTNLNGGGWGTATNWASSAIANGVDAIADFSTINITAARTVTLDGNRTVGRLRFADATTASHDWTLATGTSGTLTLNVNTGTAEITTLNRVATISAVLAGNDGLTVSSAPTGTTGGTLVLSAANTLSGGITLNGGVLQLNNNAAAGSNQIVIAPSANTSIANRVQINAGVTLGNEFIVNGGAPVAGNGVIQGVGTGRSTLNGPIYINGNVTNGGHFTAAAGNELLINGPITSTVGVAHRAGRIIYAGGGNGYNSLVASGTVVVGATNGISPVANVQLGGSENCVLDLNGFDQTLSGLRMGNASANSGITATANLGGRTLTLDNGFGSTIDTLNTGTGNAPHAINATAGGKLSFGAAPGLINVADSATPDDLTLNGVTVLAPGGLTKSGSGTLNLNGATINGSLLVSSGALGAGRSNALGTGTVGALTLDAGSSLTLKAGAAGTDSIAAGSVTSNGAAIGILPAGGILTPGTYPLLSYTGTSPGVANFFLQPFGRATASLVDTGSAIALQVTANDRLVWTGALDGTWDEFTQNWNLQSSSAPASFVPGDEVIFPDGPVNTNLFLFAPVSPSRVNFTNTPGTIYTVSGSGFAGAGDLVKSGTGTVVLSNTNPLTGRVAVNAGTLELDHDATGNVVLNATPEVAVSSGATLRLTRDDANFNFNRPITGAGTVEINPRTAGPGTTALAVQLQGASPLFSGTMRLTSPFDGTYRLQQPSAAALGTAAIEVQDRAQLYTAASQTYTNAITIAGIGYQDASGYLGSLRLENGAVWAGPVNALPGSRICAHNSTATISGPISGGDVEFNISNYNNGYTILLTGANSYGATIIGGQNTQTAGVPSYRVNVGNGGTTGTLGSGPVTVNGDGANGVIGFDRSNGYTLLPGQTITGGGANVLRTFVDLDCTGPGFSDNGVPITMGGDTTLTGGFIRVGQTRANATANLTGTHTSGQVSVAAANGATMNINAGARIGTGYFSVGQAANSSGTINQAAGTEVVVADQLRLGHWPTETSVYNMNGGSLTLTGESPFNSPSTAAGGGAGTAGDNNINATNPATIVGGGIYLGNDGTGIFNQNAGTVTTNWVVLDNRGNNGAGANMPDGIDRYNLLGGTLNVRSSWGIIGRNVSTAMLLGGGTIRVDNTGIGTGTGPAITIPIDVVVTTAGSGTVLDTNGAGNGITFTRNITGPAPISFTGGGSGGFSPPAGLQTVSAPVATTSDTSLTKTGTGHTVLSGAGAGITGPVIVSQGRLDLPVGANPGSITVDAGASLGGEVSTPALTLNGGTLFADPNTPGGLTAGTVTVNGTNTISLTGMPQGAGPWTVFRYTNRTGSGTVEVAGAADFRVPPTVTDSGSAVSVNILEGKGIAWTGAAGSAWDLRSSQNWVDTVAPFAAERFHNADIAVFPDGAANPSVSLIGLLQPAAVGVVAESTNYALTSTDGNQLTGPGGITKSGASTLTLAGPNLHTGATTLSGGTISLASAASLGSGATGNGIAISNGARLNFTAGTDLLATRSIEIGSGGAVISMTNAAAQTVNIPGNLTGAGSLNLTSGAAGAPTFALGGANQGFSGDIMVDSNGGGVTTLRLASNTAVTGGNLTLAHPVSGAAGAATALDLGGFTLPGTTVLVMNSTILGTTSYRSQVIGSSAGGVINAPIQVNGTSIVQFSTVSNDSIAINGPVTEGSLGFNGPSSVFFLRGAAGTGVVNGTINLPNATVSKTDGGTWTINSTGNSWATSGVVVGTLRMGAAGVLPANVTLILGQNDGNAAALDLNGFNQTVGSLQSNPPTGANANSKSVTSAAPAALTVNQEITTTYASQLTGALSLRKAGGGSLTLASANPLTTTGGTFVDGGTLQLSTTLAASPLTVNSGGTLTGNGTASVNASAASGSVIAPGPGVATLRFGADLAMAAGSVFDAEITSAVTADRLAVTGVLSMNGTVRVTLAGYSPVAGDSFDLVDAASVTGSPVFDFAAAPLPAGLRWDTSRFAADGIIRVAEGGVSAFDTWAAANGVTGGLAGDDDGDGASNLLEFATNSDPKSGRSVARSYVALASLGGQNVLTLTVATREGSSFAASGNRQSATRDGVNYLIEAANDLNGWGVVPATELSAADAASVQAGLSLPLLNAGWEWHTFRTEGGTAGDPADFIRLKVIAQP
jgi:autotransporter-associated beta strand protein